MIRVYYYMANIILKLINYKKIKKLINIGILKKVAILQTVLPFSILLNLLD